MAHEHRAGINWERLTIRKAEYLREFADGRTEREVADRLDVSLDGVRSAVEDLKDILGVSSVRDVGRFWRARRTEWVEFCARAPGTGRSPGAGE